MLTFDALRAANVARIPKFRNARGEVCHNAEGSDWPVERWFMALIGEVGELANLLKKIERGDYVGSMDVAQVEVAKEIADAQIYLDILAFRLGVNLGEATLAKFNEVSRRVGADVFIAPRTPWAWYWASEDGSEEITTRDPHLATAGAIPLYR